MANLFQIIFPFIGLLISLSIIWIWMFISMLANEKITGGFKVLYFFMFFIFSFIFPLIYLLVYKDHKLRTFFIWLVIAVVLTSLGYVIGGGMQPL